MDELGNKHIVTLVSIPYSFKRLLVENVLLNVCGLQKEQVDKAVESVAQFNRPYVIAYGVSEQMANQFKASLEQSGAVVSIKQLEGESYSGNGTDLTRQSESAVVQGSAGEKEYKAMSSKGGFKWALIVGVLSLAVVSAVFAIKKYTKSGGDEIAFVTEMVSAPDSAIEEISDSSSADATVSCKIVLVTADELFDCLIWDNVRKNGCLFREKYDVESVSLKNSLRMILLFADEIGEEEYSEAYRKAGLSANSSLNELEKAILELRGRDESHGGM